MDKNCDSHHKNKASCEVEGLLWSNIALVCLREVMTSLSSIENDPDIVHILDLLTDVKFAMTKGWSVSSEGGGFLMCDGTVIADNQISDVMMKVRRGVPILDTFIKEECPNIMLVMVGTMKSILSGCSKFKSSSGFYVADNNEHFKICLAKR